MNPRASPCRWEVGCYMIRHGHIVGLQNRGARLNLIPEPWALLWVHVNAQGGYYSVSTRSTTSDQAAILAILYCIGAPWVDEKVWWFYSTTLSSHKSIWALFSRSLVWGEKWRSTLMSFQQLTQVIFFPESASQLAIDHRFLFWCFLNYLMSFPQKIWSYRRNKVYKVWDSIPA